MKISRKSIKSIGIEYQRNRGSRNYPPDHCGCFCISSETWTDSRNIPSGQQILNFAKGIKRKSPVNSLRKRDCHDFSRFYLHNRMYTGRNCQGHQPGAAAHGTVGSHCRSAALAAGAGNNETVSATPLVSCFTAGFYQPRSILFINNLDKRSVVQQFSRNIDIGDNQFADILSAGVEKLSQLCRPESDGNVGPDRTSRDLPGGRINP